MNDNPQNPNSELIATKAMLEVTRMDLEEWGKTAETLTRRLACAMDTISRLEDRCAAYSREIDWLREERVNIINDGEEWKAQAYYWEDRYELIASEDAR